MKSYSYSSSEMKKSTTAAAITGTGSGFLIGGAIVGVALFAGWMLPVAGLAAGAYFGGAAVMANTAWGLPAAIGIGAVGAIVGHRVGKLVSGHVATKGSAAGIAIGAIVGGAVAGVTKLVGAGIELAASLTGKGLSKKKASKAAKVSKPPVQDDGSSFAVKNVKSQFKVATNPPARNDNTPAPQTKPAAPKNAA